MSDSLSAQDLAGPRRRTRLRLLLAGYVLLCALALIWPIYPWVMERVPRLVFGLPSGLVWSLLWVLATFGVLALFHRGYQGTLDAESSAQESS